LIGYIKLLEYEWSWKGWLSVSGIGVLYEEHLLIDDGRDTVVVGVVGVFSMPIFGFKAANQVVSARTMGMNKSRDCYEAVLDASMKIHAQDLSLRL
jgi:hypothetical protein